MNLPGDAPLVVVTGGTGIVGSALVPHLIRLYPGHRLIVLSRAPRGTTCGRVTELSADLIREESAADSHDVRVLQDRTTLFVHCAADTRFNLQIEEARTANVEKTRRALQFASGCRRLEQFAHISTLYIAGRRPGPVDEEELQNDFGYFNTYEQSKHEAETLVLAEVSCLPVAVYRLSTVVAEGTRRGYLRQLLRLIPWSAEIPAIPACVDSPVDLISADWCADALATLIVFHFAVGSVRHICAGAEGSLTFGELMKLAFDAYEEASGRHIPRPELVSLREFAPPRLLEAMMTFLPHLSVVQPFRNQVTSALLMRTSADIRPLLWRILEEEFAGVGAFS